MNVTYLFQEDINNHIKPDEHLDDEIEVFSINGEIDIIYDGILVYKTKSITLAIHHLLENHIYKLLENGYKKRVKPTYPISITDMKMKEQGLFHPLVNNKKEEK